MDNGGGAGARSGLGFWDIWDPGRWSAAAAASSCSNFPDNAVVPTGGGDHHHLTCLKLGKRQYYGGDGTAAAATGSKRERPPQTTAMSGPPPRCQVADCDKVLWDAKEYHRRHKVCEAHSKAPRVVVLGSVQRFCQQCSRFHAISEFDDSKRSCRRRLAGHNERRRKSSGGGAAAVTNSEYIIMNPPSLESTAEVSRFAYESSRSRALSLLSSKAAPWISTPDLPSRSSAALRELIAENRAATLAHQLISEHGCWRDNIAPLQHKREPQSHRAPTSQLANIWSRQLQDPGNNLNADIMQMPPGSSLDIFSRIGLL